MGGRVGEKKTKIMLYSTQLKLKLTIGMLVSSFVFSCTTCPLGGWVGGRVVQKKTKAILFSTQLML